MSLAVVLAIGGLGGLGSVARVLLDGAVSRRLRSRFPLGMLAVNLSGSFALGLLVGAALSGDGYRLAGTGLLGAYTTFSTWMLESRRLAASGRPWLAALNVAGSLGLGLLVVSIGHRIGAGP